MMTTMMMALAAALGLAGALGLGWVVWRSFQDSMKQGMMSLLVPGYALYYGWARLAHPRGRLAVAGALAALLAAGAAGFFSTAFEPNLTIRDAGGSGGAGALDEDWADFEDLEAP